MNNHTHFLKLLDFTPAEIQQFLDTAADLKAKKKAGIPHRYLEGKNVVVVSWEKGLNVTGIRYGVHPTTNVENQTDVSKQVSIYNSDGKPMDQFDLSTAED